MSRYKAIPGFAGAYDVNDRGVVRSLSYMRAGKLFRRGKPLKLKTHVDEGGYVRVSLRRPGMQANSPGGRYKAGVHRLVALAHINPFPCEDLEVAHLDGDKQNNRVENLAWVSHAENVSMQVIHGTHASMKDVETCLQVFQRHSAGKSLKRVAEEVGMMPRTVRTILAQCTPTAEEAAYQHALETNDPYLGVGDHGGRG